MSTFPWPLSEVPEDEATRIMRLPPKMREKRLVKLRAEIVRKEGRRRAEHELLRSMPFLRQDG